MLRRDRSYRMPISYRKSSKSNAKEEMHSAMFEMRLKLPSLYRTHCVCARIFCIPRDKETYFSRDQYHNL
ncbi:hypothetical protein DMN91_010120, partial [Ooceraea biroi]